MLPYNSNALRAAVTVLASGGIIIYPTETAYALGCDATNPAAVREIFKIKGRGRGKSLPLIVASRRMAEQYARFGLVEKKLAKKHWPGALTLVVHCKLQIANCKFSTGVVSPDGTIAMRVSSHPIARGLSRALGRPIVATSANRSGEPVAYTVKDALRSLDQKNGGLSSVRRTVLSDAVVDAGRLPRRKTSTVVKISDGKVKVLRRGAIRLSSRAKPREAGRSRGISPMRRDNFAVYILTNKYHSVFYIGITNWLPRRSLEHKLKIIPGFTAQYNITKLAYFELFTNPKDAIAREKQLKGWRREKKIKLIEQMNPKWKDLGEKWDL